MALIDKLTAIADAIRARTGGTAELSLDDMVTEINSMSTGSGNFVDGEIQCYYSAYSFPSPADFVKRQGNAVIFSICISGLKVTNLDHQICKFCGADSIVWKPKEQRTFNVIYEYADASGVVTSSGLVKLDTNGDFRSWSYEEGKTITKMNIQGGFEAEPLT